MVRCQIRAIKEDKDAKKDKEIQDTHETLALWSAQTVHGLFMTKRSRDREHSTENLVSRHVSRTNRSGMTQFARIWIVGIAKDLRSECVEEAKLSMVAKEWDEIVDHKQKGAHSIRQNLSAFGAKDNGILENGQSTLPTQRLVSRRGLPTRLIVHNERESVGKECLIDQFVHVNILSGLPRDDGRVLDMLDHLNKLEKGVMSTMICLSRMPLLSLAVLYVALFCRQRIKDMSRVVTQLHYLA